MERQYKAGDTPNDTAPLRLKREQFPWMFDVTKCAYKRRGMQGFASEAGQPSTLQQ